MTALTQSVGRGLGATVGVVAILATTSALTMPVPERLSSPLMIVALLLLLTTQSALYWFGEQLRQRIRVEGYLVAQGLVLFGIAVCRPPMPMAVALFAAATAEGVLVGGARWGATRITVASIAIFVVASLITSSLYFATTAGLVLALTGLVAHALAGLAKPAPVAAEAQMRAVVPVSPLSAREVEVLRELVGGARNGEIAQTLGITERTVKSHLKSVYQKLGVESRSAAVARALQERLV